MRTPSSDFSTRCVGLEASWKSKCIVVADDGGYPFHDYQHQNCYVLEIKNPASVGGGQGLLPLAESSSEDEEARL
jgi:hypothetical protein